MGADIANNYVVDCLDGISKTAVLFLQGLELGRVSLPIGALGEFTALTTGLDLQFPSNTWC